MSEKNGKLTGIKRNGLKKFNEKKTASRKNPLQGSKVTVSLIRPVPPRPKPNSKKK